MDIDRFTIIVDDGIQGDGSDSFTLYLDNIRQSQSQSTLIAVGVAH